jgi:hypothetical protein
VKIVSPEVRTDRVDEALPGHWNASQYSDDETKLKVFEREIYVPINENNK